MYLFKFRLSPVSYVICVALFFTLIYNWLFLSDFYQLIALNSFHNLLFFISGFVLIFAILNIFFSILLWRFIAKPLVVIFLLIAAAVNYFMYFYHIYIDKDMLQNVLDTTPGEAFDLFSVKLVLWLIVFGFIPVALFLAIRIGTNKGFWSILALRIVNIVVSLLVIIVVAFFFYKDYSSLIRNNKQIVKLLVPSNVIGGSVQLIRNTIDANRPYQQIGLDAKKGPLISQEHKKTLVVLVVGETARAKNFFLGDYHRNTNPALSQRNDVVYFNHTSSCGTSTAVSVPCMFSDMPREDYDAGRASHQDNVLDILQRTGISVLWLENDGGCKGVCKRVPTIEITKLNKPGKCKDGVCLDSALMEDLSQHIDQLTGDGLIVLHQMGSHGPAYYKRYTEDARVFTPTCDTNQIQDCSNERLVNTYDNTIVYTDKLLAEAVKTLESYQDKYNILFIYLSDHGESLGEKGFYLHGAPYSIAPREQTHIPMLFWLSKGYQDYYKVNRKCLTKRAKQDSFSQDNLFHTLLGAFNIQTSLYQSDLDVLHAGASVCDH